MLILDSANISAGSCIAEQPSTRTISAHLQSVLHVASINSAAFRITFPGGVVSQIRSAIFLSIKQPMAAIRA
jgi:hypothetical protein